MELDEPRYPPTPEFSPEDTALIIAEINAIREELNAPIDKAPAFSDKARPPRAESNVASREERADALAAVCYKTPAELLADHERRLTALERKFRGRAGS